MLPIDKTVEGLAGALSLLQRRHEVLVSNVANLETPGYRARELDFGDELKAAFTSQEQAPTPTPQVDPTAPARADGNSVDLDLEKTTAAANAVDYEAVASFTSLTLKMLATAINGSAGQQGGA
jgi:flagellar basal-body rod protein FlgB